MNTESKTIYCPTCNDDREYRHEVRTESMKVRGDAITADVSLYVCTECGDTQPDRDNDPMVAFYAAYRQKHDYLLPDDINRIREKYGMSHTTFASLLGMSPASLYRYERGSLQDEAHDELIRSCDDPLRIRDLVVRHRDRLSDLQYRRFHDAFALLPVPIRNPTMSERITFPVEFSGNRDFNYARYAFLVTALCTAGGPVFPTKLNKQLFYCDFLAYALLGRSITGSPYRAIQYGPVPMDYGALRERLELEEFITCTEVDFADFSGTRIEAGSAVAKVDEAIDSRELTIIQEVAKFFRHYKAKEIRDYSHNEAAYLQTPQRQLISYQFASQLQLKLTNI